MVSSNTVREKPLLRRGAHIKIMKLSKDDKHCLYLFDRRCRL
nr:MAG TPA: hypothetical protein [Crassvirales sp.]